MKWFCFLSCGIAIALTLICSPLAMAARAQNSDSLVVDDAAVCRGVRNRQAVEPGTHFPATIGTLFCFSRIVGAKTATRITHVWYYGNVERARITLPVKSAYWRTYSTKTIRPDESGVWHIDILDPSGNRLEALNFNIDRK